MITPQQVAEYLVNQSRGGYRPNEVIQLIVSGIRIMNLANVTPPNKTKSIAELAVIVRDRT